MKHLRKSISEFDRVAKEQEKKGIMKYGKALDPLDRYDWLEMAKEEQVDGFKYLQAEIEKRKFIVNKIRNLLKYKTEWIHYDEIEFWLDELEGKNNGQSTHRSTT